jgi:hypothetical protein
VAGSSGEYTPLGGAKLASFVEDTAAATGKSTRAVKRDATRAKALGADLTGSPGPIGRPSSTSYRSLLMLLLGIIVTPAGGRMTFRCWNPETTSSVTSSAL